MNSRKILIFTIVIILFITIPSFLLIKDSHLIADEKVHYEQITFLIQGSNTLNPYLTTLPGYHTTIAILASPFNSYPIPLIRTLSFLISLTSIIVFYFTAKEINKSSAELKTLQYAFLPILFPLFFLIYTDVLSLLLVMLSFLLLLKNKHFLATLIGITSITIRQTNIIWLGFIFLIPYIEKNGFKLKIKEIKNHIKKYWLFLIGFLLFALFIMINKGVAIGDKGMHPLTLQLGNIYFSLFLFFFLFLPLNIKNLPKIIKLIKRNKSIIHNLLGLLIIFLFTFNLTHPYNQEIYSFWLRNKILLYFSSSLFLKIIFFIPIAYSILSLAVIKLHKKSFYLIYPITILFLLPSPLIEQRYYLIPLALFILTKKKNSNLVEYSTILIYMIISTILFYGITNLKYFL